jgi:hypothetical protein
MAGSGLRAYLAASMLAALSLGACNSIGPPTVARDRGDYGVAIGDSWKQQTLLNIVKLRYADFPVFLEVGQVIAGYQLQTTVSAGVGIQNYVANSIGGPVPAIGGTAGVSGSYIDRPTVMYAPLTGTDFIKKLMTPIPPSAVLFLLQSGYSANVVFQVAVDSINGVSNESGRAAMRRPADPRFGRLAQLVYELQLANAFQVRIERGKDNSEASLVTFPPVSPSAEVAAKIAELREILHLSGRSRNYAVFYGGYSGKGDDIAMTTRSMLQIMLELGAAAQIPDADITVGKAAAGASDTRPPERALINILSGPVPPADAHVAVRYKNEWFWIADNDLRSKTVFGAVMLLFSISEVGIRTSAPVVTVPAN